MCWQLAVGCMVPHRRIRQTHPQDALRSAHQHVHAKVAPAPQTNHITYAPRSLLMGGWLQAEQEGVGGDAWSATSRRQGHPPQLSSRPSADAGADAGRLHKRFR